MDVDGTLTDGRIYMGPSGEAMKAFDVKDGLAVRKLLPQGGVVPVIMTGRRSQIVARRAEELEIPVALQGVQDKEAALRALLAERALTGGEAAYIGDDLGDIPAMRLCAYAACPADAADEVKKACSFVCTHEGGRGAVREFAEWLLAQNAKEEKE